MRDLQHHLSATHGEQPRYYHNMDQFKKYSGTSYTLACGECSAVMSVNEAERHVCGTRITLECPWCRQVMLTQEEVEGHIVNGCCQVLKLYDETPSFRDIQVGKSIGIPFFGILFRCRQPEVWEVWESYDICFYISMIKNIDFVDGFCYKCSTMLNS